MFLWIYFAFVDADQAASKNRLNTTFCRAKFYLPIISI
ncbi:hypothetical protein RV07_GL000973 [Enterococcus malodoratus]|nr:hypothetical protein RV07_GL000973 [Enterococcus malodoratus]